MNPLSAQTAAIAAVVALVVGFGAGWSANGWRLSAEVNRLQGVVDTQVQSLATLEGANKRCTAGVAEVKSAVKEIADDGARRTQAAASAMAKAAEAAKGHLADAKNAMNRPPIAPGQECAGVAKEASAYAKKRKAAP